MMVNSGSTNSVDITTTLIVKITGLPQTGEDPGALFTKAGERALSEEMKEKFRHSKGKEGTGCPTHQ
jgi:hypothetical protein